jgi:3-phenylpropionate/trans-cinnamate dioxygenase ferredoxin subunit
MLNYNELPEEGLEFITVADEDEIEEGERLFFDIDDLEIVLFKVGGKMYAIGDVCSHDDGPLGDGELEDYSITCPRHGARFDVRTGDVLSYPAYEDIPAYPIRIEGGQIKIGLPIED